MIPDHETEETETMRVAMKSGWGLVVTIFI